MTNETDTTRSETNAGEYMHFSREILGERSDGSLILGEREALEGDDE